MKLWEKALTQCFCYMMNMMYVKTFYVLHTENRISNGSIQMQALCTVEDACKKAFQHPCIAAFTGGGDVEYFIICEQSVASKISGFQNALFTLFSTYYVYHLAYPPQASNVFYFLQDYILARPDCGKRSGSYLAVVSDIKQNI